jgi:hypothetical protein
MQAKQASNSVQAPHVFEPWPDQIARCFRYALAAGHGKVYSWLVAAGGRDLAARMTTAVRMATTVERAAEVGGGGEKDRVAGGSGGGGGHSGIEASTAASAAGASGDRASVAAVGSPSAPAAPRARQRPSPPLRASKGAARGGRGNGRSDHTAAGMEEKVEGGGSRAERWGYLSGRASYGEGGCLLDGAGQPV